MLKRVISLFMCNILLLSQFVFSIGIVADTNAPEDKKPEVGKGTSINPNIPVVNIAPPDGSGVSHNLYQRFNIDNYGLILNNSTSITETVLGGYIDGNPRLMGRSAGLIINEVTGSERSLLFGTLEVAGQPADVIIANINGITVNGAGFINVNRLTLTTGEILYNKSFEGIKVKGGDILIEGTGLKAGSTNALFILSKSARVEGEVKGSDINFVLGSNQFNNNLKLIKVIDSEGKKRWAFSSSALGGIYGDRIRIVVTEKGAGVNAQGSFVASEEINIDSQGNVRLNNAKAGSSVKVISKEGNIDLKGQVSSAKVELSANRKVTNEGTIDTVFLKTNNFINKGEVKSDVVEGRGDILLNEGKIETSLIETEVGEFENKGDINSEYVLLSSEDFMNSGNMETSETMVINSLSAENIGYLKGKMVSFEGEKMKNTGYIEAQELATVNSDEFINKGDLKSKFVYIEALNAENTGNISGEDNLFVDGDNIKNEGIISGQNVSILAESGLENKGNIISEKMLNINENNNNLVFRNEGLVESEYVYITSKKFKNNETGNIKGKNIYINSANIYNEGIFQSEDTISFYYEKENNKDESNGSSEKINHFTNKGEIKSQTVLINAVNMENSDGGVIEGDNIYVSSKRVINKGKIGKENKDGFVNIDSATAEDLLLINEGEIVSGEVFINAKLLNNKNQIDGSNVYIASKNVINEGSIKSETLSIDALSVNNTNKGTLEGKTISLNSQSLLNEGSIKQTGTEEDNILYIKSENFDNKGSVSSENTSLIEVAGRINNEGNLNSESEMVIYSNTLNNSGEIKAKESLYIAGNEERNDEENNSNLALELLNTGTIESESVALLAENLNNEKEGTLKGSNIYIESEKVNNKGVIKQEGKGKDKGIYIKSNDLQNYGTVESEDNIVFEAKNIKNTGNIGSENDITLLTDVLDNEGKINSQEELAILGISEGGKSEETPKASKVNNKGSLEGKKVVIFAKDLNNDGSIRGNSTYIEPVVVNNRNIILQKGKRESSDSGEEDDEGEEEESQNFGIYIKADNLQNSGDIEADANLYLEVKDKVANTGNITSLADLLIYAGTEGEGDDVKLKRIQSIENEGTIKGNNTSVITENLQNLGDISADDSLFVEAFNFDYRIGSLKGKKIALKTATIKQDVFDYLKPSEALHLESLRDSIVFKNLNYAFRGDLSIKSAEDLQISNSNLKANNLALSANNDLVLYNSDAVAKDTLSLSTTQGDINILAEVKEETKSWSSREKRGNDFSYVDEKKNVTEKRITYDTSYLEGKDIYINSGGNILVEGADIKAKGGDVLVQANGDLKFKALKNVYEKEENKEKLHFTAGVHYRTDSINVYEKRETVVSSNIEGKNIYLISKNGNITIEGATYKSDNLIHAKAKGNIDILSVYYTNDKLVDEDYNYFIGEDGREENLKSIKFKNPNLISKEDIQIISDQTVKLVGAKIEAEGITYIKAKENILVSSVNEIEESFVKEAGKFDTRAIGSFLLPVETEGNTVSFITYESEERKGYSENTVSSLIKADKIKLETEGNIDIVGSKIEGITATVLEADGDINIVANLIKENTHSKIRKDSLSIGFNASTEEISVYGGIQSKYSSKSTVSTKAVSSLIRGGVVNIITNGDLNLVGSNIEAGILEIEANDVNILDVYETQATDEFYQEIALGVRAGIKQNLTSAIESVKAVGNSKNTASTAFNTLKAIDSISGALRDPVNANVDVFAEASSSTTTSFSKKSKGSSINAVTATINASGDVYLRGSNLYAVESLDITANNLILEHSLEDFNSSSFSTNASASYTLLGTDQGTVKASYSQMKLDSDALLVKGSSIKTKSLKLNINNNVKIKGSSVEGETVEGEIGGDLIVETVLSHKNSKSETYSTSTSNSGSLNAGFGFQRNESATPDIQAKFIASSNFNVKVNKNAYIKGGIVGSLQEGKTNFSADKIISEDVQGYSTTIGFNTNIGVNINPNNPDQTGDITNLSGNITDYDADISAIATLGTGDIQVSYPLLPDLNRDLNNTIIVDVNKNLNLDFYYSPSSIKSVLDPIGTLETWKHNTLKNYIKGEILVTNVDDLFTKGISFTALRVSKGFKAVDSVASLTLGDSIIEKIINNAVKSSAEEFYYAVDQTAKNAQDYLIENNEDYADLDLYQGSQINNPNDEKGLLSDQAGGYNTKEDEIYINTEETPIHEGSEIIRVVYTEVQRRDNNLNHGDLSKEKQTELAYYVGNVATESWLLLSDGPDEEYTYQDAIEWNEFVKNTQLFEEGNKKLSEINPEDVEHLPAIVGIAIAVGVAISDAWDIYDAYKEGGSEEAVKVAAEKLLEIPNPFNKPKKLYKVGSFLHKLNDRYDNVEKLRNLVKSSTQKIDFKNVRIFKLSQLKEVGDDPAIYLVIHKGQKDKYIYVGNTYKLRQRIQQHKTSRSGKIKKMEDMEGLKFEDEDVTIMKIPMEGTNKYELEIAEQGVYENVSERYGGRVKILNARDPIGEGSKVPVKIDGEIVGTRNDLRKILEGEFKGVYEENMEEIFNYLDRFYGN